MANELQFRAARGLTCYYVVTNQTSGYFWSTSGGTGAFGAFLSGAWPDYAISVTEQGTCGKYQGNWPSVMAAGVYSADARQQLGGTAAQTDPGVAEGDIQWNGSIVLPTANLATSGQLGQIGPTKMAKGVMVQNFGLYFKSSLDHITPFTSGVVSGQIARDAGAFGALQSGAFTEVGLGFYRTTLTSGDLAGDTVKMLFSATGISGGTADPLPFSVVLQRVSGSP